jgi:hypothetical protein
VCERFFTPRLRFKRYDELNAWLMDKCVAWRRRTPVLSGGSRRSGNSSKTCLDLVILGDRRRRRPAVPAERRCCTTLRSLSFSENAIASGA